MDQKSVYKIILVGPTGVGKSSLLLRHAQNRFDDLYRATLSLQYSSKRFDLPTGKVLLQVWDTAGQEAFRSIAKNFYRSASAVIFIFSLDSRKSFQQLDGWIKDVQENADDQVVKMLVGNKFDLQKREIEFMQAERYSDAMGSQFFMETSAKTGHNVQTLFQMTAKILQHRQQFSPRKLKRRDTISSQTLKQSFFEYVQNEQNNRSKHRKCCF